MALCAWFLLPISSVILLWHLLVLHLVLWLNDTPLYGYTTLLKPLHQLMDIGLSLLFGCDGHLCVFRADLCFHFSRVYMYLVVKLLDHVVILWLIFQELLSCFPKQLYHFKSLPAACASLFPHVQYLLLCLCDYRHLSGCEVLSGGFDISLTLICLMLNLLCAYWSYAPFLQEHITLWFFLSLSLPTRIVGSFFFFNLCNELDYQYIACILVSALYKCLLC